jgi:hypothetical protein
MEEAKHKDFGLFYSEVDRIRKSSEKMSPGLTIHLPVNQWMTADIIGASIKHVEEIAAKPRSLLFIPRLAGDGVFLHLRKEV